MSAPRLPLMMARPFPHPIALLLLALYLLSACFTARATSVQPPPPCLTSRVVEPYSGGKALLIANRCDVMVDAQILCLPKSNIPSRWLPMPRAAAGSFENIANITLEYADDCFVGAQLPRASPSDNVAMSCVAQHFEQPYIGGYAFAYNNECTSPVVAQIMCLPGARASSEWTSLQAASVGSYENVAYVTGKYSDDCTLGAVLLQ